MKHYLPYAIFGTGLLLFASTSPADEVSQPDDKTVSAAISYKLGYHFGQQFAVSFRGFSVDDTDPEYFKRGLRDGINRKAANEFSSETVKPSLKAYSDKLKKRLAERATANAATGKKFMEEFAVQNGVQRTESGILYRVIEAGEAENYSAEKHGESPNFHIIYKGSLIDGTVFDETSTPLIFSTHNMITGLAEVLKTMPVGARWHVVIPSELAYGENGPGIIGPNSPLIFDIRLKKIETLPHSSSDKGDQ